MSLVSWIGLLRQGVGLVEDVAGLVVDEDCLELVEPPSRPMTLRTCSPAANVAASKLGM